MKEVTQGDAMMSNWQEDVLLRKGQQPGKGLKIDDIHSESAMQRPQRKHSRGRESRLEA